MIADGSDREIARIKAGNGRSVDLHEFQITPQGTALFFADVIVDGSQKLAAGSLERSDEVARWDVLAGERAGSLAVAASAPRSGFETAIQLATVASLVAVRASDASGRVLGTSAVVATGRVPSPSAGV